MTTTTTSRAALLRTVVVGSAPVDPVNLLRLCRDASQVVCADGGASAALAAGITPTAVVGDFDSLCERDRIALEAGPVAIYRHRPDKDRTDLELALYYALEGGATSIILTGVLGGRRTDHALGNIFLLTLDSLATVDVRIDEGRTEARVVRGAWNMLGSPGEYVSLLPVTERVSGVSTRGLRYPLHGEELLRGYTRGVSNEFLATEATVSVESGLLLVVHERTVAGAAD